MLLSGLGFTDSIPLMQEKGKECFFVKPMFSLWLANSLTKKLYLRVACASVRCNKAVRGTLSPSNLGISAFQDQVVSGKVLCQHPTINDGPDGSHPQCK